MTSMMNKIKIVSAAEMSNIIDKPHDNIGLYLSMESDGTDIVLVACDNSTGNAGWKNSTVQKMP